MGPEARADVTTLRLADLLASVSLVSDLGFALPPTESMRSCLIATALARRLGLDERDVSDVFYTALLQHLGCTGFAHETAAIYGDELVVNAAVARVDTNDLGDVVDTVIRATTRRRAPVDAARVTLYTLVLGDRFGRRFAAARCEVGRETARRLGLPGGVSTGLAQVAESWDGRGGLLGLRGDDLSPAARIATVAATAARFDVIGGPAAVIDVLGRRAGRELDPAIAAALSGAVTDILRELAAMDPHAALLAAEPRPHRIVPEGRLPEVAAAIGDVADLKSTYTIGHSSGVHALAVEAGARSGLDPGAIGRLEVAALLHDIGRVGISDGIWERRGKLTTVDWEQVRLHPYHTERILSRSDALRPMAVIAGMHHERPDGTGYHRGAGTREIGVEARIIAAADAFQAMTQERPHRAAWSPGEAAERLTAEARVGRLADDAVDAVIAAAGLTRRGPTRRPRPAGLSDREVDVLRLLARGLSNREIGARLVVSSRTAEHHVQHIYAKIGASSRAAAALFAMEHDLLD
jgi:HD-GYP domain-containing protein (c-di-GMP phosphodiesterase class II)